MEIKVKYKLNVERDVDIDGEYTDNPSYILNLPHGFRFYDPWDYCHVRGYDSMEDLRKAVKLEVEPCDCPECQKELDNS